MHAEQLISEATTQLFSEVFPEVVVIHSIAFSPVYASPTTILWRFRTSTLRYVHIVRDTLP